MKTISLEEAKKLATPGRLTPKTNGEGFYWIDHDDDDDGVSVANTGDAPESKANAALLAHCWNTHDELVEALEKAIELASMEDGDYYKADDAGEVERVKAVLARARTVDTP